MLLAHVDERARKLAAPVGGAARGADVPRARHYLRGAGKTKVELLHWASRRGQGKGTALPECSRNQRRSAFACWPFFSKPSTLPGRGFCVLTAGHGRGRRAHMALRRADSSTLWAISTFAR